MAGMNGIPISMANVSYEEANECSICLKNFHAFRSKHRCKACGNAVCRTCASSQKKANLRFPKNDSLRICDRCVQKEQDAILQRTRMLEIENARARQLAELERAERQALENQRRLLEEAQRQKKAEYEALVAKHFGNAAYNPSERRHSFDELYPSPVLVHEQKEWLQNLVERADEFTVSYEKPTITQVESISEECAICLEVLEVGNAIYTTACGHSFHWSCLKEIKQSSSTNSDQCPSCRSSLTEVQIKKKCDHPRVRMTHKFCRDCGEPVTAADVKPRPDEAGASSTTTRSSVGAAPPASGSSLSGATYRAGSQGALVQCPQCRIHMRVLPHMYNMRVACPQGHMFQVQVAPSSNGPAAGRTPSGTPAQPGVNNGYPGSFFNSRRS